MEKFDNGWQGEGVHLAFRVPSGTRINAKFPLHAPMKVSLCTTYILHA